MTYTAYSRADAAGFKENDMHANLPPSKLSSMQMQHKHLQNISYMA